jgi:hypothetical protein
MKITKLLFLSIVVILFSCSEDEDPLPTSEGMVGTWSVTGITYKGTTTTSGNGMNVKADFTGTGKEMDFTTTFDSDPNTVTSEGSYVIELKTTVMGQSTTEDYTFNDIFTDGTWTLNGRTLSVASGGTTQEGTITKQTSTTLEVRINLDESESDSGFTVTTEVQAVYTFEKL